VAATPEVRLAAAIAEEVVSPVAAIPVVDFQVVAVAAVVEEDINRLSPDNFHLIL